MLAFCARNGSNFDVNLINLGQDATALPVIYAESGTIETMEYLAPSFAD